MTIWVYLVESVGKDTNGGITALKGITVGTYINSIGKTADNQYLWTILTEIGQESSYKVLTILGALSCADDIYYLRLIKVCITFIEKYDGGVRTFPESLRIVVAVESQSPDTMFLHVLEFKICPFHRLIPVFEGFDESWRTVVEDIPDIITVFVNLLCIAYGFI
jgi:hypothetical protein